MLHTIQAELQAFLANRRAALFSHFHQLSW